MAFLTELWLPILLSAVFVFIASSISHMVLPFHKKDYRKMNNEDTVLEALRASGVTPGTYPFPCAGSVNEMGTPEMVEKMKKGPLGFLTVLPPGGFNMGKSLAWWFVYLLIVGVLVAYVGWHTLTTGADYLTVFRITGAAAILGYAVGVMNDSIWKGQRWSTTAKFMVDGFVYALLTAGTFGWLWPDAAA